MNISFKSLGHIRVGKKQKDGGIFLLRTVHAWLVLCFAMLTLLVASAVFAMYMFSVGTNTTHVIITNPVDTVHYQSVDIEAALHRYDDLRTHFTVPTVSATGTSSAPIAPQPSSTSTVATSTPVRVE